MLLVIYLLNQSKFMNSDATFLGMAHLKYVH